MFKNPESCSAVVMMWGEVAVRMHEEEAIKLRLVMTILFREMGTRAAAFSAKIKSLRELQAKVGMPFEMSSF